jgi:hypothetical protein
VWPAALIHFRAEHLNPTPNAILALADGMSYREIERKLGASAPTVSKRKGHFEQKGVEGLQDGIREASRAGRRQECRPASSDAHSINRPMAAGIGLAASCRRSWA